MKLARIVTLALISACAAVAFFPLTTDASAQIKRPPAKPAAKPAPKPAAKPSKDAGAEGTKEVATTTTDGGASAAVVGTLDGGGKVFKFGELEIEGRLKSPQLVYFLRRVRAEFAAGDLGHRSFMLELSQTRQTENF